MATNQPKATTQTAEAKAASQKAQTATGIEAGTQQAAADVSTTKKRIAVNKIIMYRAKERIVIPAGKSFSFTADELKQLPKEAVRTPVNENTDVEEVLTPVVPLQRVAQPAAGAEAGDVGDEL